MAWMDFELTTVGVLPGNGNVRALITDVKVYDAITGLPANVMQDGQAVSTVRADATGWVTFQAEDVLVARIEALGWSRLVESNQQKLAKGTFAGDLDNAVDAGLDRAEADGRLITGTTAETLLAGKVDKGDLTVSVRDHGATGNGATDDTAAVAAAVAAAAGSGAGRVFLPRGTYKMSAQLTIPSGVTLEGADGAVLDFRSMPAGVAIAEKVGLRSEGSIGAPVAIGTAIAQWSRTVAGIASTAGFAAGDLVRIRNEENSAPGGVRADRDKGELNIVASVDSATQITLRAGTILNYSTNGLVIEKITPVENVTIRGVVLRMGGVGSAHSGIRFTYARNVTVRDCHVRGGEDNGISLSNTWGGLVQSCTISDSTSPGGSVGNTGYGVAVVEGSRFCQVLNNRFENCRVFVDGGGYWPSVNVDVVGNYGSRTTDFAFATHEPCFYWRIAGNTLVDCAGGIQSRGQHVTIEGNTILNVGSAAIRLYTDDGVNEQVGLLIRNNYIRKAGTGIDVDGQSRGGATVHSVKKDVQIVGNTILESSFEPILLRHFNRAVVSNNLIRGVSGATTSGIRIAGVTGITNTDLTLNGNNVSGAGAHGIYVTGTDWIVVTGNSVRDNGNAVKVNVDAAAVNKVVANNL